MGRAEAKGLVRDQIAQIEALPMPELTEYTLRLPREQIVTGASGRRYRLVTDSFTDPDDVVQIGVHIRVRARGVGLRRLVRYTGALLRSDIRPMETGPGNEYFANLPPTEELDVPQRLALGDIRSLLSSLNPTYAPPGTTRAAHSDYGELSLTIEHSEDPDCKVEIHFGDGYLAVSWPGFSGGFGGWKWQPEVTLMIEALLAGRNRQVITTRLGRLIESRTEMWSSVEDWSRTEVWKPLRTLPLRLLPLPSARRSVEISFDRADALKPDEIQA